jgi:protein-L-isoaspartate(D-aspartate) O-methyltransferase
MIEHDLSARGIRDPRVLAAMGRVPRERFVPPEELGRAYGDHPLPIGHGQTISQPYIVAFMTEQLRLRGDEKVLEIGTGSGYQAAVLAECAAEVYTIEIVAELAERSGKLLRELGYDNVHARAGDGYRGWPEQAPFEAIILTAAPDHVPQPLLDQLADGGRMIRPRPHPQLPAPRPLRADDRRSTLARALRSNGALGPGWPRRPRADASGLAPKGSPMRS